MGTEGAWSDAEPRRHAFEFPAGDGGRPAEAIAEAVRWFADVDGDDLQQLSDVVDLGWLSRLFEYGSEEDADAASPSLAFEYGGCLVTVEPGRFTVERLAGAPGREREGATGDRWN